MERTQRDSDKPKGPSGKQTRLISMLRRQLDISRGPMPETAVLASKEIERLLALKGTSSGLKSRNVRSTQARKSGHVPKKYQSAPKITAADQQADLKQDFLRRQEERDAIEQEKRTRALRSDVARSLSDIDRKVAKNFKGRCSSDRSPEKKP